MRLTLTKKRDPSEKDALVVMLPSPGGERKVTFKVNIGETVDMTKICKDFDLDCAPDELGYAIMGDKRFKGLFKLAGTPAAANTTITKKAGDFQPNAKKTVPTKNKSVAAGSYDNKSQGAG